MCAHGILKFPITNSYSPGTAGCILGYATFPSTYTSNPNDDGVVIFYTDSGGGAMVRPSCVPSNCLTSRLVLGITDL